MSSFPQPLIIPLLLLALAIKGSHAFHSPNSLGNQPGTTFLNINASSSSSSRNKNSHYRCNNSNNSNTTPNHQQLSMTASYSCPNETTKNIYDIPNSGWKSPQWNWGSARGTGHDCASICRRRWSDESDRKKLVQSLLDPVNFKAEHPTSETSFEEVKLILGLAWQNGRWTGADGGPGGYSAVLETMAAASRYENEDEVISAMNFIEDVSSRFDTIARNAGEKNRMKAIANEVRGKQKSGGKHAGIEEVFMARRECAGMVLDAMNYVASG